MSNFFQHALKNLLLALLSFSMCVEGVSNNFNNFLCARKTLYDHTIHSSKYAQNLTPNLPQIWDTFLFDLIGLACWMSSCMKYENYVFAWWWRCKNARAIFLKYLAKAIWLKLETLLDIIYRHWNYVSKHFLYTTIFWKPFNIHFLLDERHFQP